MRGSQIFSGYKSTTNWGFHQWESPKWLVYMGKPWKTPSRNGWVRGTPFQETPKCSSSEDVHNLPMFRGPHLHFCPQSKLQGFRGLVNTWPSGLLLSRHPTIEGVLSNNLQQFFQKVHQQSPTNMWKWCETNPVYQTPIRSGSLVRHYVLIIGSISANSSVMIDLDTTIKLGNLDTHISIHEQNVV